MFALYPVVKNVHIVAVVLSGLLFAVRGLGRQANARWVMAPIARYTSYCIDTVLLAAAIALALLLRQYPLTHNWLTIKVLLLAIYIVLGSFALKRAKTPRMRATAFIGALSIYAAIIAVARTHYYWS